MRFGYSGRILRLNLTQRKASVMDTEEYEQWGGGHGMGAAIFWDLCRDKTISGFDPGNVVTIMANPMSGTLAPSSSRCEIQGIGPQAYPIEWFTRSSFGGRFAAQLKYAGWDGIVIEGRADSPVWVNVVNDHVSFEDARDLWGLDTKLTQEEIWRRVTGGRADDWQDVGGGSTTQRPAVLCVGPAGERLSRIGVLLHDAGNVSGQGGFGGVFGAKNLKAISVRGTGGVPVADPQALMDHWAWYRANFVFNVDSPMNESPRPNFHNYFPVNQAPGGSAHIQITEPCRPFACQSCMLACRRRNESGIGNESHCMATMWPNFMVHSPDEKAFAGQWESDGAAMSEAAALSRNRFRVADQVQRLGVNAFELLPADLYLVGLHGRGVLGPGKAIECGLPFDQWATAEYKNELIRMIAFREGIGNDLAEGLARAAERWGRYQEDTASGLLNHPNWGYFEHYDPRVEVEQSYGSILGDRDTSNHGGLTFALHKIPEVAQEAGVDPPVTAEQLVEILAERVVPYAGDPFMFDYSEGPTGIYSIHKAKMVAWARHYNRFWLESVGNCDFVWPNFFNINAPDMRGATPEGEPRFFGAVTGRNLSFEDGMEAGRKIWNLDRAIWILQGRHRDMEVFAEYVYTVPVGRPAWYPVYENGTWAFKDNLGRTLDRNRFEEWKTLYFEMEGWDGRSGWPTRNTLEDLGLKKVADELQAGGRLGE